MKISVVISMSLLALFAPRVEAADLLLKNANILNPKTRIVTAGHIVIHDDRIVNVVGNAPGKFNGPTIDLSGKWVVPAFTDMHVHAWGNPSAGEAMQFMGIEGVARANLYAGVTSILDLFNDEDEIFGIRDQQRKSGLAGAAIYAAGALLTCTKGHGTEYPGVKARVVDTPSQAEASVIDLVTRKRPDVVKIVYDHAHSFFPSMDRKTMEAAVATANRLGVKSVVHIGSWQDVTEAVLAGATAVTHLPDEDAPSGVIDLLKERDVAIIPTMVVQSDLLNFTENLALLEAPLAKALGNPEILDSYRNFDPSANPTLRWFMEFQRRGRAYFGPSLKRISEAGARIMVGTDMGNVGTIAGYSVHREMKLMVDAGMSTWAALAAGTTEPGKFLGEKFGVESGDVASLVVLTSSPIEDIENTQKIDMVIQKGRIIDREDMLRSLK